MAKEVDLKKVELKVSVNCCDGCKRKVKKLLQGIEGVLKTEIDSSQPKVTVIGNVDPNVLVKKLMRAGKQAEIIRIAGNQKSDCKEAEAAVMGGNGKLKDSEKRSSFDQEKCSNSREKIKEIDVKCGDGEGLKKDQKELKSAVSTNSELEARKNLNSQPNYIVEPGMVHETGRDAPYTQQYCYVVEPSRIPLSYYAVAPHVASPTPIPIPIPIPIYYGADHYLCQRSTSQPSVSSAGDYFSNENTVGCLVM